MNITEQIFAKASHLIDKEGTFVVSVEPKGKTKYVVYVDGKDGVSLNQCTLWNRNLRTELESSIEELTAGDFELEVSSFGVGRALQDNRQWAINIGRTAVVKFYDEHMVLQDAEGKLEEVADNYIILTQTQEQKNVQQKIAKPKIEHIHIEVTF